MKNRFVAWARDTGVFLRRFLVNIVNDDCVGAAGVLAYATLVSLVPLLAVTFGVFAAFPAYEALIEGAQNFLLEHFVPGTAQAVRGYLLRFAGQAAELTFVGVVTLVIMAVVLLSNIERTLNRIWRVKAGRTWRARLLVYWAVLTLGPPLIGASLAVSSYLGTLRFLGRYGREVALLLPLPLLASFLAFTLLFLIIPKRRLSWRHALAGSLVAALLFELAKQGFGFYITRMTSYEQIYGTLAALPVFLIWLYLSWLTVLIGAEFAYALATFQKYGGVAADPALVFVHAFRLVGHLWMAQRRGAPLSQAELLDLEPALDETQLKRILGRLRRGRLVHAAGHRWALSRDIADLTLHDVYLAVAAALPHCTDVWAGRDAWNNRLCTAVQRAGSAVDREFAVPLRPFYEGAAVAGGVNETGPVKS